MIVDFGQGRYYVYRHLRKDNGEIFYIGIGTKPDSSRIRSYRSEYSRAYTKQNRGIFWNNIIKNHEYEVEILLESDDYEFVKAKEIEFIKLYGRRDKKEGTLVNCTDGGDGLLGAKFTDAHRAKISEANKGNSYCKGIKHSEDSRRNMSKASKIRGVSKECREGHKRWLNSEEGKEIMRAKNLNKSIPEEVRAKISKSLRGRKIPTEVLLKRIKWRGVKKKNKKGYIITAAKLSKKVLQVSLEGEIVKEWSSITECSKNGYGLSHVSNCCNGKELSHKGFMWKFK